MTRGSSIRRAAAGVDQKRKRERIRFPRIFRGTVDSVDGGAKTATVRGIAYKYVETPTAIAATDKVLVIRTGPGSGYVVARFP